MTLVEVFSKVVRTNLIVMAFVLVIHNSVSLEEIHKTEGLTPASVTTSHDGGRQRSVHPFFLDKLKKFDGSASKQTTEQFKDGKPLEELSTSSKLIIPNEGGILHITRPMMGHETIHRLGNATGRYEVPTKLNSNSIEIPVKGGPVYVDFPDYVKYGIDKLKKTPEDGQNVTSKGSEEVLVQIPGKGTEVHGMASIGGGNSTQVSEESSSMTSEQPVTSIYIGNSDYPFFAAVHATSEGVVSFDNVRCSGGIFSRTAVVTSCSCLYGDDWPAPPFLSYYVSVGHRQFATINNTRTYYSSSFKCHPSCKKTETGLWKGNIAMLVIDKPGIKFGEHVQPMNLPKLKMWDASDVLANMSDQRRHCRVIGWSRKAPLIDTALGRLIPLDECANPICQKHLPCPRRNAVDGFMVEITPNEPALLTGALLYCSGHVFAIVNTKRECPTNNVFASCSPEELLYTRFNFELTPEAQSEMHSYRNTFSKSIVGWETYSYPPTMETTTVAPMPNTTRQGVFADVLSSGSIVFPFYASCDASWIYTYVFMVGYYGYVFD